MRNRITAGEAAGIIERFLNEASLYPQEWNDFIESSQSDVQLDLYRKRCEVLDPLVNSPAPQDSEAIMELRKMVVELRNMQHSK